MDCGLLQFIKPNLLVFGEKYPSLLADERQPNGVLRARIEVASVALVFDPVPGECVENGLAVVKIFVEVKNEIFRQRPLLSAAPTGLLLRSVLA